MAGLVGLSAVSAASGAARANDNSNIPGIPLPGAVVTGQLGGPIYDQVFSIQVPGQRVLLLSLSGSPRTDFDLYLFDSSATTVYSTQGQVAVSKGPASTESITYPVLGGGTFYIDLNGATDVEGTFQLTVQVATDTTPPRVTLSLGGGAPATRDATVTATVVGTDDLSGVDSMQFSPDGTSWQPWQPYTPAVLWSFEQVDGRKDLSARVRDRAGNLSAVARASIVVDTVAPSVLGISPDPVVATVGVSPTFRVTFSEPIQPATWTGGGLLLQDPTGVILFGAYSWDAGTNTGSFTPGSPLVAGATYVLSLAPVLDLAGNRIAPLGAWTVRAMLMPTISLVASATLVPRGASVTVTGRMVDRQSGPLTLERSVGGGPWDIVQPLLPDSAGRYAATIPIEANTQFRVHYGGSDIAAEALSAPVRVLVRREVVLAGVASSVTRSGSTGRSISLTAALGPSAPDLVVTFRVYRYDAARRVYRLVSTVGRTSVGGRAVWSWRPSTAGRYYVRLTTPPTALFANGISPAYRWVIG